MRWFRRLMVLGLFGCLGVAVYLRVQRRRNATQTAEPVWPPMASTETARPFTAVRVPDAEAEPATRTEMWMPPLDGACPPGYPIKANDASGIFHMPGGRFYNRTIPERCYATADDAVSDGYRAAKA